MLSSNRKVLFVGNGINRAFQGDSWELLMKKISGEKNFESKLPMPLQAVIASQNHIDLKLKEYKSNLYGAITCPEMHNMIVRLLTAGFDEILTTNYSYEFEMAAAGHALSDYALGKLKNTTQKNKNAEGKYLIHTYNEANINENKNRIWHIHGEARTPNSMIIGHYYYCNLVTKIKDYSDKSRDKYISIEKNGGFDKSHINSWIDSFIMCNVFILGMGCDPSEIDIWWLLERKRREKAVHGKTYYYCPWWEYDEKSDKIRLLRYHDVKIEGTSIDVKEGNYVDFYNAVIDEIVNNR